jgi:hypothetical protein
MHSFNPPSPFHDYEDVVFRVVMSCTSNLEKARHTGGIYCFCFFRIRVSQKWNHFSILLASSVFILELLFDTKDEDSMVFHYTVLSLNYVVLKPRTLLFYVNVICLSTGRILTLSFCTHDKSRANCKLYG